MILSGHGIGRESRIQSLKLTVTKIIEVYLQERQMGSAVERRAAPVALGSVFGS